MPDHAGPANLSSELDTKAFNALEFRAHLLPLPGEKSPITPLSSLAPGLSYIEILSDSSREYVATAIHPDGTDASSLALGENYIQRLDRMFLSLVE